MSPSTRVPFGIGLLMAIPIALVAWWFSSRFANKVNVENITEEVLVEKQSHQSLWRSFLPIVVPLLLIAIASFSFFIEMPTHVRSAIDFIGHPVMALLIGFGLSLFTLSSSDKPQLQGWIKEGILHAGSILVIVGAGGIFG